MQQRPHPVFLGSLLAITIPEITPTAKIGIDIPITALVTKPLSSIF